MSFVFLAIASGTLAILHFCVQHGDALVARFARNIKSYQATQYNETQARREFINPMFKALGWDIESQNK